MSGLRTEFAYPVQLVAAVTGLKLEGVEFNNDELLLLKDIIGDAELEPEVKEALYGHYVHGKQYREMAAELQDVSHTTVWQRAMQGVIKLRELSTYTGLLAVGRTAEKRVQRAREREPRDHRINAHVTATTHAQVLDHADQNGWSISQAVANLVEIGLQHVP